LNQETEVTGSECITAINGCRLSEGPGHYPDLTTPVPGDSRRYADVSLDVGNPARLRNEAEATFDRILNLFVSAISTLAEYSEADRMPRSSGGVMHFLTNAQSYSGSEISQTEP
jgi:hypothetical protein